MIITLCNGKGGSGKTTLSVLLGSALVEAGHKVALLDTDPQRTATRWIEEIGGLELAAPGKDYGALFIDTAPRLESKEVSDSIRRADVVVLVTSPSPADLFTSRDTATLIHREGAKDRAYLLFNQVQPSTAPCDAGRHINMPCSWVGNLFLVKRERNCSRSLLK
jgi:chromosome partitioning protein